MTKAGRKTTAENKQKVENPRQAALEILYRVEQEGAYANIALNKKLNDSRMDKKDRGLTTELTYGTLRQQINLDWVLSKFISRSLSSLTPWIRNILRMSLYQIMNMDKIPDSAAVNEGVNLAKKFGHKGTVSFVNGVLRNILRNIENLEYPSMDKGPAEHISIKYSHPLWMVKSWIKDYGIEDTIRICQANNQVPANTIRVNTIRTSKGKLLEQLINQGIDCKEGKWAEEALEISNFSSIQGIEGFAEGLFQVQDESSMLIAHIVNPQENFKVLDTCGAPGGKTTHLAQLMKNTGEIFCVDIHEHKLDLVHGSCRRLGITNVKLIQKDARELHEEFEGQMDCVLVDAPCSGLGILRRKPDIRWRKEEVKIKELQKLQKEIITSAAKCVKPGGVLVYSTCTITHEENQQVIIDFLQDNRGFITEDLSQYLPKGLLMKLENDVERNAEIKKGWLQLLPHLHGSDGFFMARIRRK